MVPDVANWLAMAKRNFWLENCSALCAVSVRLVVSYLRTASSILNGSISAIGRWPMARSSTFKSHSCLAVVASAWPSRLVVSGRLLGDQRL